MRLQPLALLLALVAPAALAQKGGNNFELHLNGKNFGKDTYTLNKAKSGYKLDSHYAGAQQGNSVDFKDTISYTDDYTYITGSESNQDSNLVTEWLPTKDMKQMGLNSSGSGSVSAHMELMPTEGPLLVMPAFDAGAAQAALLFALPHLADKNVFTLWLPGYALSGLGARAGTDTDNARIIQKDTLPPGGHAFTGQIIKGPAATGTLDGKPVALNTYQLGFDKYRWTFFTDQSSTLMQVDVSVLNASYIRAKFKLDPIKAAPGQ
jgi:hypothetical protein